MIFNDSDVKAEFARIRKKNSEDRQGQNDTTTRSANEQAALQILEKEKAEFNGQAITYYLMLTVIFLLFFAIHAPSYRYLPAAAFCSFLLTPQLLKFHYRLRQYRLAEKICNEEQLKKIIYFSDAHSKTIFPKKTYPNAITFFKEKNAAEVKIQEKILALKSIAPKSVAFEANYDGLFSVTFHTKSFFLSGSQKVCIRMKENGDHFWLEISSLPRQRRRTLEMGRNKINVLIAHELTMQLLHELHTSTAKPLGTQNGIDIEKMASFSPEHLPIPIDKIA